MANQQADFLVIGSGLAGLNAAIELSEHGSVLLLSKVQLGESNTAYAQGGIASVMSDDDSFDAHVRDTLDAGAGLCHPEVVEQIIEAGPSAIRRLVETGVQFDASDQGFSLTREGGHSNRRILHAQDITGREIDRAFRMRLARNLKYSHFTTSRRDRLGHRGPFYRCCDLRGSPRAGCPYRKN